MAWRAAIRVFSFGMARRWYMALTVGIRFLIESKIDERFSDTGIKEEQWSLTLTVLKYFYQVGFLVALFNVTQRLKKRSIPYGIGVFQKTEKGNAPEKRP